MGNVLTQFISSSAEQLKLIIQMLKDVLFLEMGWDTVLSPLSYSYVLWLPRWPFVRTNFQLAGNFDRTGKLSDQEKIHFHTITLQEYKHLFFFDFMFLLVMLIRLSYYYVIFYILTGQKRDVTVLKFLWLVNMPFNSPKFFLALPA